jgi:hypothetical protein
MDLLKFAGVVNIGTTMDAKTPHSFEKPDAWTEYVGVVTGTTKQSITIEVVQRFSIPISPDALKKSKRLRKGNRVGILVLEDGAVRIRSASS